MKKAILLINTFLTFSLCAWSQNKSQVIAKEKMDSVIFNYFTQEYDTALFILGSVYLMPSDSVELKTRNIYGVRTSGTENGTLEIYFKKNLLFRYETIKGQVNGLGYCYYPFSGQIAVQGQFKDGKLDGLVFLLKENGLILEIMRFKKGKYLRHEFHWLSRTKKSLKLRSKNRSNNPLRNDELVVV